MIHRNGTKYENIPIQNPHGISSKTVGFSDMCLWEIVHKSGNGIDYFLLKVRVSISIVEFAVDTNGLYWTIKYVFFFIETAFFILVYFIRWFYWNKITIFL